MMTPTEKLCIYLENWLLPSLGISEAAVLKADIAKAREYDKDMDNALSELFQACSDLCLPCMDALDNPIRQASSILKKYDTAKG